MAKIDVRRLLDMIAPVPATQSTGGITPLLQAHLDDIAVAGAGGTTHESWTKCASR